MYEAKMFMESLGEGGVGVEELVWERW